MKSKNNIEQNKIQQEELFSVPDGYFEKLENDILYKTVEKKHKSIPLYKKAWLYPVAASFIAGLLFFYNQNEKQDNSINTEEYIANISEKEIITYLNNEYADDELLDYVEYYGDLELKSSETVNLEFSSEDIYDELEELDIDDISI